MGMVVQDRGCKNVLDAWLNNSRPAGGNSLSLRLFTSNTTPARGDTTATYTEAAGGGYAAKTLAAGSWTNTLGSGAPSSGAYAQQTWTFTGALTGNAIIYGYHLVDADGYIVCSERLAASFQPQANGDQLSITPQIQMSQGTPA